jgi:hypothetical protein
MKKLLFGFSIFLVSGPVWAFGVQVWPHKAIDVCARLSPKETRDACNHIIASASYDEHAVGVCNVLKSADATLNCLTKIKNSPFYNDTAIDVCYRHEKDNDVIECLDQVAGEYLEDKAVLVCNQMNNDIFATDCLDSVTGNTFAPGIIEECDKAPTDEKKIQCFDHNSNDPTYEQLDQLRKSPSHLKPTLDLRQFLHPNAVSKCLPEKQDCNSDVKKQIEESERKL